MLYLTLKRLHGVKSCCIAIGVDVPEAASEGVLRETTFAVPKMDCAAEESMVRMALEQQRDIQTLEFDLVKREVKVVHASEPESLAARLHPLGLGGTLLATREVESRRPETVHRSIFSVPKMDCSAEENLVQMALGGLPGVHSVDVDLTARKVAAEHTNEAGEILARLEPLHLGATLLETSPVSAEERRTSPNEGDRSEAWTLKVLLGINGLMFLLEFIVGVMAQSTGLIADSLDMFADAAVYGLALYAVGKAASMKVKAAHIAGWLQLALALGALAEVVRRFIYGSEPESGLMMGMALVALVANVICLALVAQKRDRGAHMTASYIFSANDVIANLGVLAAGALVVWTASPYPDLVIGAIIAVVVLNGARRILRLK
jgi:cation transport ATPase